MKRGVKNEPPAGRRGKPPLEDSMGTTFDKSLLQSKQVGSTYGLDEGPRKQSGRPRPMTTETAVGRASVLKTSFDGHDTEESKDHPIKEDNSTPPAYMTIT